MVSPSPVEGPGGKEEEVEEEGEEVEVSAVVAAADADCADAFLGLIALVVFLPLREANSDARRVL